MVGMSGLTEHDLVQKILLTEANRVLKIWFLPSQKRGLSPSASFCAVVELPSELRFWSLSLAAERWQGSRWPLVVLPAALGPWLIAGSLPPPAAAVTAPSLLGAAAWSGSRAWLEKVH